MSGTVYGSDLSKAAALADANTHSGAIVRVRLDRYGFRVSGRSVSSVREIERDYHQMVLYRDAELSDGFALYEAVRKVVKGLGREFVDLSPSVFLVPPKD